MMVGDPKQSIYGFNSSGPEYMEHFRSDFHPTYIELTENFRSSKSVVSIAQNIEPSYEVDGQLPIPGAAVLMVGRDEEAEARLVVEEILKLANHGHPDVEGSIQLNRCAILGRTRFSLLAIERELKGRSVPFFKRLSSAYENESDVAEEFLLALRLLVNPRDMLHLASLAKKWKLALPSDLMGAPSDAASHLKALAAKGGEKCRAVIAAINLVDVSASRADLMPAIKSLRSYADSLADDEKSNIYNDTEVMIGEWDQYLRTAAKSRTIAGFLSSVALGTTQQINSDGVALLTVHSSKGLEFDVVFIVGMSEGVFPDYRSIGKRRESEEERRNMFVAATRSKRLLYFSYPASRVMPWGDVRSTSPSSYLRQLSGLYAVRSGGG
jgi:DNA helicase-2/ATP-dependent DNA helicase PcrA